MKKPKWVIFDVGQVLYDFHKFVDDLAPVLNVENKLLWKAVNESPMSSFTGAASVHDYWKSVLKILEKDSEYETLMNTWENEVKYWMDDTRKLLKEINKKEYRLALLTNNWASQTENLQKNLSSFANIEFIIESSVEKLQKPDKRLYELVENRLNSKGKEIFFIDDRQENLDTAIQMGWQTFLYSLGEDEGKTSNDKIRKILFN